MSISLGVLLLLGLGGLWRRTRKQSGAVRRWFARGVAPALDRAWSHWLVGGIAAIRF